MSQRVYILLPVHNRCEVTRRFIDCLKIQTFPEVHLVLIDDGSQDGTEDMVRSNVPTDHLTVIKGNGKWWWAGSLQQGIKWLNQSPPRSSDIVLIINDDVIFEHDFIQKGVNELQAHPETLLLAKRFDESKKEIIETGLHADFRRFRFPQAKSSLDINCLSTRGLFLRWDVLAQIGGFYPRLLPHYGSDYEFTIRAARKGLGLRTSDNVYLISDQTTTGIRKIDDGTAFLDVLKVLSDKKSVMNPLFGTTFILLVSPKRWAPGHIVKVWARAVRHILKSFMGNKP